MKTVHLSFDEENPNHMIAYDYLQTYGRKKSRFITRLICNYLMDGPKIPKKKMDEIYRQTTAMAVSGYSHSLSSKPKKSRKSSTQNTVTDLCEISTENIIKPTKPKLKPVNHIQLQENKQNPPAIDDEITDIFMQNLDLFGSL